MIKQNVVLYSSHCLLFHFFGVFPASEGANYLNLIIFTLKKSIKKIESCIKIIISIFDQHLISVSATTKMLWKTDRSGFLVSKPPMKMDRNIHRNVLIFHRSKFKANT